MMAAPNTVVITGASSGLGEALALRYACGSRRLGLVGRHPERLAEAAGRCRALGSDVHTALIDVRDRVALAQWLHEFDDAEPIDLVIANAGVSTGTPPGQLLEDAAAADQVMEVNVLGVLNTIQPILPAMVARRRGQMAIMSSLAGLIALPDSPAYSGSKSAVLSYGLALRQRVHAAGVRINVICPGYIASPMTAKIKGWKPLEMPAASAAERIAAGLERDRAVIAFPWPLALAARLGAAMPDRLRRAVMAPFGRDHSVRE